MILSAFIKTWMNKPHYLNNNDLNEINPPYYLIFFVTANGGDVSSVPDLKHWGIRYFYNHDSLSGLKKTITLLLSAFIKAGSTNLITLIIMT